MLLVKGVQRVAIWVRNFDANFIVTTLMPAASCPLVIIAGVPGAGQWALARRLEADGSVWVHGGLDFAERVKAALDAGSRVVIEGVAGPEPGLRLILEVSHATARRRSRFYADHWVNDRRFVGIRRINTEQVADVTSPETDVLLDGELKPDEVHAAAKKAIADAGFANG